MTRGPTTCAAPDEHAIQGWLAAWLAEAAGLGPDEAVDVSAHLDELGLDSVAIIGLSGELESWLGVRLPPTVAWEYPTVQALAAFLSATLHGSDAGAGALVARPRAAETPAAGEHPLSHGERALFYLHHAAPLSTAYTIAQAFRLRVPLQRDTFHHALGALVERHAALRSTFRLSENGPVKLVAPTAEAAVAWHDAAAWDQPTLDAALAREARAPFDLAAGPLLRIHLFGRAADEQVLLLVVHHVIADLWSLEVLLRDLAELYAAAAHRRLSHANRPLPLRPSDVADWQAERLQGAEGATLLDFWEQALTDAPTLRLPTDHPRPTVQTFHGGQHAFKLDAALTDELRAFARQQGTTLYTLLAAVYQVLLFRYTDQEDILIGSPTSGRRHAELADLVGYFVNPVVLRARPRGDLPFTDFLGQVHQVVRDALAHQDYPFPLLVERLQPQRDPGRSPLFQASFTFQRTHLPEGSDLAAFALGRAGASATLSGLRLECLPVPLHAAQFDLALTAGEVDDVLVGAWEYNTALFEPDTIARLAGHFETLLRGVLQHPATPLADLPLLTDAERHQVLIGWNQTDVDFAARPEIGDRLVHQLIEAQVARTPEAVALAMEDGAGTTGFLTYGELNVRANRLAAALQARGVGTGQRVGLCADRSFGLLVGLLAILKAGGAYVPLDASYPADRLQHMLEDAACSVVLVQPHLRQRLPACADEHLLDLALDGACSAAEPGASCAPNPCSGVSSTDLAYVLFTSGSTGRPKGAMISHDAIRNRLLWMSEAFPSGGHDRVLQKTPISFDVSLWELLWPLMTGARLVLARPDEHRDSASLVRLIRAQRITIAHFVPSMLQAFLDEPAAAVCQQDLRLVVCSGEVLPLPLQERLYARLSGADLYNLYGPTEAAVDVTAWACERQPTRGHVPIGRPIANTRLYILDRAGHPRPIGVPGELVIGGANVGDGYVNAPGPTAERFVPDPFSGTPGARLYRTGDLARYGADGVIEFLGRLDDQVKIRGVRIELAEIELVLGRHPDVRAAVAAVDGAGGAGGQARLVGYVVPRTAGAAPDLADSVRRFAGQHLPEGMVPSVVMVLDALPLGPSGKVDRRALPPPRFQTAAAPTRGPRDALELRLALLWQDLLAIDAVDVTDSFFDLGGHSLLALSLLAEIEQVWGCRLPVATLVQGPTIAALAGAIRSHRGGAALWPAITPLQTHGALTPLFCASPGYGDLLALHGLARHLGADQPFYALHPPTELLDGRGTASIHQLAEAYVQAIRAVQPHGPYLLAGYSIGGLVAVEAASRLSAAGESVAQVVLLDSYVPSAPRLWGVVYRALRALSARLPAARQPAALRSLRPAAQDAALAAHLLGLGGYRPSAYHGRVTLLAADAGLATAVSVRRWQRALGAPVRVEPVPGRHDSMLREPHVATVADALRACLGVDE